MLVRYFAAAMAASGVAEEKIEHDGGAPAGTAPGALTLGALLERLEDLHPASGDPARLSLARVLSRSSFLVDEVNVRDRDTVLAADAVVDILPPFAGG